MKNRKVLLAISGGVDSAYSAYLLKQQQYDVRCLHFLTWQDHNEKSNIDNLKKLADFLQLPLDIIDAKEEFYSQTIQKFLNDYTEGKTPNPCVFCNKNFKFKKLLQIANEEKADYVATGHYAITKNGELFRGIDHSKDQSFFLHRLSNQELQKIIFPLGKMQKTLIKKEAQKISLTQYIQAQESQDLCFVNSSLTDFLRHHLPSELFQKGKIIHYQTGKELGEHQGLILYTIGQRTKISGQSEPLYVYQKNFTDNLLIVSENQALYTKELTLQDCSWIKNVPLKNEQYEIQIRYQAKPIKATIVLSEDTDRQVTIVFQESVRASASGQSAVIYKNDQVIGGGIIL